MTTINELLEEKRKELGETIKNFVHRFPGKHNSNYPAYSQVKNMGRTLPKAWVASVAKLLDMSVEEVCSLNRQNRCHISNTNRGRYIRTRGSFREVPKAAGDTETQQKKIADMHARARLIVGFAAKLKNHSVTRLILNLYSVDYGGVCLQGYKYSYRDWNFHALIHAVLEELNINWSSDPSAKKQVGRELIDSIGKDDADKLSLSVSAFDVFGYLYSREEMPELYHICRYGI